MKTKTIAKIIKKLEAQPNRVITSKVGSECCARRIPNSDTFKDVIPGDTFSSALMSLHYLLFDLGVDVGLTDEELKTLQPEVK